MRMLMALMLTVGLMLLPVAMAEGSCIVDEPGKRRGALHPCRRVPQRFRHPEAGGGAWEPGEKPEDYEWWLARTENGGWQLVTRGYC